MCVHICVLISLHFYKHSNEIWWPWLQHIGGGYLEEVEDCHPLPSFVKTYMHAYIAATTCVCHWCGQWTPFVNVLIYEPQCWDCFAGIWCGIQGQLMVRTKAAKHYLLPKYEAYELPRLVVEGIRFVSRRDAEYTAISNHESLDGLRMEKERRNARTVRRYEKALAAYKEWEAALVLAGLEEVLRPKEPSLPSTTIKLTNCGSDAEDDELRRHVLVPVGFCKTLKPWEALRG